MQRVLLRELDGWRIDHTVTVGEPGPVLVHFTVQVDPAAPFPDADRLYRQLAAAILTWDDWVLDAAGAEAEEIAEHLAGLPQGYKDDVDPVRALADLRRIRDLGDEPYLELSDEAGARGDELHFRLLLAGAGVSLSAVLPVLHSLGVEVLDERPYEIVRPDGSRAGSTTSDSNARSGDPPRDGRAQLGAVPGAVLRGVPRGLDRRGGHRPVQRARAAAPGWTGGRWRCCAPTRTTRRSSAARSGAQYVAEILLAHPAAAQALVELFRARFDPAPGGRGAGPPARPRRRPAAIALIDEVSGLDADRILRGQLALITATLRTNWFQQRPHFSFKIDPSAVPDMPLPRPRFEIFVYAPRMEGVHLRFGPVARGGLRWSDRPQDYRTEILGPGQGPGGEERGDRARGREGRVRRAGARSRPGRRRGLLPDVHLPGCWTSPTTCRRGRRCRHRTSCATTATTPTWWWPRTRAPPGSPTWPTMWPAATASGWVTRSPPAARWATTTRPWGSPPAAPGRACAGISGSWAVDTQTQDLTVVGIGDMSGDVFGNGMLLSKHIRLVARVRPPARVRRPGPRPGLRLRRAAPAVRPPPLLVGRLRPGGDQPWRRGVAAHREGGADRAGDPGRARPGRRGHLAEPARS